MQSTHFLRAQGVLIEQNLPGAVPRALALCLGIDASLIEADANKQNSTPKEDWEVGQIDPADAPRAVREYLDTLDGERMNAIGSRECANAFGAASEVQPKFTSHSDPASQCLS